MCGVYDRKMKLLPAFRSSLQGFSLAVEDYEEVLNNVWWNDALSSYTGPARIPFLENDNGSFDMKTSQFRTIYKHCKLQT